MIVFKQRGNFNNLEGFLDRVSGHRYITWKLNNYGQKGVDALQAATPKRTGKTADSWSYEIIEEGDQIKIVWNNSNYNKWAQVAVLIQYGHGTRNGGYVEGIDYINPAMKSVFQDIADAVWEVVVNS